jgi:RNA polymerase subunit RPABC4/transcription elongation factor Spt4
MGEEAGERQYSVGVLIILLLLCWPAALVYYFTRPRRVTRICPGCGRSIPLPYNVCPYCGKAAPVALPDGRSVTTTPTYPASLPQYSPPRQPYVPSVIGAGRTGTICFGCGTMIPEGAAKCPRCGKAK